MCKHFESEELYEIIQKCDLKMNGKLHIGTSGWNYDHWQGSFYPDDLPQDQWLKYYAQELHTVEVNNSFYQLPDADTLAKWSGQVPESFLFSAKANRYITHMKKLNEPEESLKKMLDTFESFGDKLSHILFQLPPKWSFDVDRLRKFISLLPKEPGFCFEFRDRSWINDTVADILKDENIAFCIYQLENYQSPIWVTADSVYVRLHGPSDEKYKGCYSKEELSEWAERVSGWTEAGQNVFVYFNNDIEGYAPQNAIELREMTHS